ncbi:M48 family metallopeptidase, partial [Thiomicrospira sp.]|uniref:M48 family metallopeptidase n=1 Tax=Thiomicrospira sp. TaxID=935 RepID=UPI002F928D7F
WFYTWLIWMGFNLTLLWAYPKWIAPLFNKFTPLEDGEMKQRIEALLERTGFESNGIFVMDGSSRSGHGNAYFTGMGKNKRIVFFDTLLEKLTVDEVEAVLAHELGHFKHGHITKRLIEGAAISLIGLALLGWLVQLPAFYSGLGIESATPAAALLLFVTAVPVMFFFLGPIMAFKSRKHEFEADAFAAQHVGAQHLISALLKLYRDNASTLTPDPSFSAYHDSHPPAKIRIDHLKTLKGDNK